MKKMLIIGLITLTVKAYAGEWRWQIGPNLTFAFPDRKFANVTEVGEGMGAKFTYNLKRHPWINPRFDVVYLSYGEKRSAVGFGNGYGFLIQTRNESFQVSAGLHIAKPNGQIRYYFSPMAGLFNYRAVTTLPELYYYYGFPYMDTHDSQTIWAARMQIGALFDIGLGPLIDLALGYQHMFNVRTRVGEETKIGDAHDLMVTVGLMIFSGKPKTREWR
ncbi:MAG: hypothetical protein ONB24_08620 [candidate division KSB1 bacterium]|nr:hypothetical protein [candidate division KSB1 bacterium]